MTVENSVSKTPKLVMGTQTYDFHFNVLLKDPTEDEAKRAIKCSVSNGTSEVELAYGVDYTVELNNNRSGGVVTVTDPKTKDWTIVISRDYKITQESDYNDFNTFPAETLEANLDKQVMLIQQLKEQVDRAVKVVITDDQTPEELIDEVYSKLDSATEVATNAIKAADQASTAADNATKAVEDAEKQVAEVTKYIDDKKVEIDAIVVDAQNSVDTAITQATEDVKTAATEAAEAIIQDAGETATDIAVDYVNTTVKPELKAIADSVESSETSAKSFAQNAKVSELNAKTSEKNAKVSEQNAKTYMDNAYNYSEMVNPDNLLNKNTITNCLTKIPQDIKLELGKSETKLYAWKNSSDQMVLYTLTEDPHNASGKLYNSDGSLSEFTIYQVSPDSTAIKATDDDPEDALDFSRNSELDTAVYKPALVLKAGSKVYVPNGFEDDGTTRKFDVVTIESDISEAGDLTGVKKQVYYHLSGRLVTMADEGITSSSTAPTSFYATDYATWYDITNNKIKWTNDKGVTWQDVSFPLCYVTMTSGSQGVTSIDQIFNGVGYIGSTVFALPGVEGLIPNGRNEDGSLKNVEFEITNVITQTFTTAGRDFVWIIHTDGTLNYPKLYNVYENDGLPPTVVETAQNYVYNKNENLWYFTSGSLTPNWTKVYPLVVNRGHFDGSRITKLNPKTVFKAVDYNEIPKHEVVSTLPANPDSNVFYYIPE